MTGYFVSFTVTHALNFLLSLRRLLMITREKLPFYIPALSLSAAVAAVWTVSHLPGTLLRIPAYLALLFSLLYLLRIVGKEDLHWIHGLVRNKK